MPVFENFNKVKFVGNEVHFLDGKSESKTLQPGSSFDVIAEVVGGTITVSVESLDFHNPSFVRVVGPQPDPEDDDGEGRGSVQTWFNCVAISVQLYRGDEEDPVRTIKTANGKKREGQQESSFVVDAGPVDWSHTRWRLRVINTSNKIVSAIGGIGFVRDRGFIGNTNVPLRVLNHAFGVVVNALAPQVKLRGRTVHVGFSDEVAEMLGLGPDHALRGQTIDLGIPLADAEGELQSIKAEVVPGTKVREAVHERWQKVETRLLQLLATTTNASQRQLIESQREKNNAWRADWEAKIEPDFVAVHIEALFSEIDLSSDIIPGFEFDLGSIENLAIHLYLIFLRAVGHRSGHVLCLSSADTEGVVGAAESLGIIVPSKEIEAKLPPPIQENIGLLHRYFAELLARISPFLGDIPPIFIDARADETNVLVRYTSDPADQRATRPPPSHGQPIGRPPRGGLGDVLVDADSLDRAPDRSSEPADRGPLGALPPGFALGDPVSVARLDKIQTIVVVMMENRSFDHMLGYLRTVRGEEYDGFPDNARNNYTEDGVVHTVRMEPITNVLRAADVMQIPVDPHHAFSHTKIQVADGAMSGFAADLIDRGDPQFALSYYTDQQIPNYYRLAAVHAVCDRWFCAHPGPTYPNRWATLTGTIPQVENFHVDDPRLGFMRDVTIFDTLTSAGIDWAYYENNVSMIRMYGRFRLDDKNVLPYLDEEEGFERKAKLGQLPPIVFVEPRFTGIPPLQQASDDHPPANVAVGQQFITRVYNALAASPQWRNTLLVITYDEHGGFFDHVPPPGTQLGPPEWLGKVPRIHPEGADHMGPRVPTLVISPFVNPGSVSHTVFDHTSIIKTILVRHRNRFYADQLRAFGPRVMMINHLGAALNRDEARPGQPEPLPAPPLRQRPERRATPPAQPMPRRRPTAPPTEAERTDFHVSLARSMLPKRL